MVRVFIWSPNVGMTERVAEFRACYGDGYWWTLARLVLSFVGAASCVGLIWAGSLISRDLNCCCKSCHEGQTCERNAPHGAGGCRR